MSEGFTRNKAPQNPPPENKADPVKAELDQSTINKSVDSQRNFLTMGENNTSATQRYPQKPQANLPPPMKSISRPAGPSSHALFLNDNIVRSGFSLKERALASAVSLFRCKAKKSYVDYIQTSSHVVNKAEIDRFRGQILKLAVLETSQLELDPNVMHPFVKIHIVDMDTGEYIKKSIVKPVLNPNEKMTLIDSRQNFIEKEIEFIPPFASDCCDLRIGGNARAKWNHTILLDEETTHIFSDKTIVLFEILDFNKQLLKEGSSLLDMNNNYRIAWGYLRLSGLAKYHFGNSKVQLYKYKFSPSLVSARYLKSSYPKVPAVYYDFIWPNKKAYDGYLTVQINSIEKPTYIRTIENAQNIFENEEDLEDITMNLTRYKQKNLNKEKIHEDDPEYVKKQKELLRIRRFPDSECRIPNEVLYRFPSSDLGCFRLAFSPNGKYLAAACTTQSSKTIVKVFNVEEGELKYTIKAHKNIIHDIDWSWDSRYILTSSSDFTSKVWRIPYPEPSDEIEEDDSERLLLVCTLTHPSYVYSGKIFRDREESRLMIATGCFDAKVRIWRVDFEYDRFARQDLLTEALVSRFEAKPDDFANLLEHRHPNCLQFDEDGRLYVGDSLGAIHVWDVQFRFQKVQIARVKVLENSEIAGDPINQISLLPFEKKRILVHSRDNCIRNIDYSNAFIMKTINRFFGSKSSKYPIKSTASPDGQYVLSGSEDGKPYLWDVTTGELVDLKHLGVSFMGPVSDVAWNTEYHMIACAGFGDQYPILVFTSKANDVQDMTRVLDKMRTFGDQKDEDLTDSPSAELRFRVGKLADHNNSVHETHAHTNAFNNSVYQTHPQNTQTDGFNRTRTLN